jgi:peptidoglycan/xylan/chitin deacetylase (PgdA/CDA1 family)
MMKEDTLWMRMSIHPRTLILLLIILAGCVIFLSRSVASPIKTTLAFKNTTVSLTFDDGDSDNYTVRESLKRNKLHATFYIISGFIGKDGYMDLDQLHDLYADGNEIGGHTVTHAELTNLTPAEERREICQNRVDLLAAGFNVTSFSYPNGAFDETTMQTVRECGFNSARAVSGGSMDDPYMLQPLPYIVSDTRLAKMIHYVSGVEKDGGGWAILVFHHICDGCDYFSVSPRIFDEFTNWLREQKSNGLVIKTIGEVIGGETMPGVAP